MACDPRGAGDQVQGARIRRAAALKDLLVAADAGAFDYDLMEDLDQ